MPDWYNSQRQLEASGQNPFACDTFSAALKKLYAEINPDTNVRNRLIALKQGFGSVQTCHVAFRSTMAQAVHSPVTGADAVWFFKHGVNENIRLAIAIYGDDDLDTVVEHAKAVDPAVNSSYGAPTVPSLPP